MVLCFYTILAKLSLSVVVPNKSFDTDINVFGHHHHPNFFVYFLRKLLTNRLVGCRCLRAR